MNEEHKNQSLLVDQDKALELYFDALLLPDTISEEELSDELNDELNEESDTEINEIPVVEKTPEPIVTNVKKQVITAGPVSPKPRSSSLIKTKSEKNVSHANNIVFSEKDKDGNTIEQVLVPRSQILAQNNTDKTSSSVKNTIHKENSINKTRPVVIKAAPETKVKAEDNTEVKTRAKVNIQNEAPELDMSLFIINKENPTAGEFSESGNILDEKTNNAPPWAETGFQALIFSIAGLKLAIPLNELNSIVEWNDDYISELPAHAQWYLGGIQNRGKNVALVDTLQQVVPEHRWPVNYIEKRKFKHIILIDNNRWGLACESVIEVVNLTAGSVKWRSLNTKRRWLLGTIVDHKCALLDTFEFSAMLKTV